MEESDDGYFSDNQLRKLILEYIEQDRYRLTKHADEELKKDDLDLIDALHVLKTGNHDRSKTGFDTRNQTWKYAVEGRTKEARKVRVIIAFVEGILIITVMEL